MATLPIHVSASGWMIISHVVNTHTDRLNLRNARLTAATVDAAIRDLSLAMVPLGYNLIHYGAVPPVWSALLEKEIP